MREPVVDMPQPVAVAIRGANSAGTTLLISARGELDLATADSFRRRVTAALEDGHGPVHIDMSAVTFCDSQGLSALLAITQVAESAGRRLTFTRLHPRVAKVFRITGFDRRLHVQDEDIPGTR